MPVTDQTRRREIQKSYRERHKDKLREKHKAYRQGNPEVARRAARKHYNKNRDSIIAKKLGVCADAVSKLPNECQICGSTTRLCVDHCHASGRLRGRLCDKCNRGVGCFEDNAAALLKAAAYILNGDPTYLDNWHDIQGYARLVEKRLEGQA